MLNYSSFTGLYSIIIHEKGDCENDNFLKEITNLVSDFWFQ